MCAECQLCRSPWKSDPYGVVSLLTMLEFAAERYWALAGLLTRFASFPRELHKGNWMKVFMAELGDVFKDAEALDLRSSKKQIETIFNAVNGGRCTPEEMHRLLNELAKRMHEELEEVWFRVIPFHKHEFANPMWLADDLDLNTVEFGQVVPEFNHAGMCYGISENAACVFHLMRIVDFVLRKVAASLGISYEAHNWQGVGHAISKKMEEKYKTKTDDWKKSEPLYAEILTDIQAIGRGHRNPNIHEIERSYDDRDTRSLILAVEALARHVAKNLR